MLLLGLLLCATPQGEGPPPAAPATRVEAPRMELLAGRARVAAGEAWLELAPGMAIPPPRGPDAWQFSADARARLLHAGAGVEVRGGLSVESEAGATWILRLSGSGRAQVDARSAPVCVEIPGTARVEIARASAWIESLPDGAWRIGCDAGEPLSIRPPAGVHWKSVPRLAPGAALRVLSARMDGGAARPGVRSADHRPWAGFSWPWGAQVPAEELFPAPVEAASPVLAVDASARALQAWFVRRVCGR